MKLSAIWAKIKDALTPTPDFNNMTAQQVGRVQEKLRAGAPGFDVACYDTRFVNVRKNVGLVVPKDASEDQVQEAAAVFLAAAKEVDENQRQDSVILYQEGNAPAPSRFVQEAKPARVLKLEN